MAAQRAEFERLAAPAAQPGHAGVAQDRMTVGAAVRNGGFGVTRAKHGAAGQHHWWGWERALNFWNGDGDIGRFNQEFDISQPQGLADLQDGVLDRSVIDERAVGRVAIVQEHAVSRESYFAMNLGNSGVIYRKMVFPVAAKAIDAQVQFQNLRFTRSGFF